MAAAGWSADEIAEMHEAYQQSQASAPITSPGVYRHTEAMMAYLVEDVEAAMGRLGFTSQARVAHGIEPIVGPIAAKTGVIMTDESIVTVGSFLFRFCGLIARAFIRTLRLDPWLWESETYTQDAGMALLRQAPDIITYWKDIYFSFAMTGTNADTPFLPSTPNEINLMEQVARAMEIFAIAHEYGHHHLAHGKNIEAEPRAQELEADQFALRICAEVDNRPVILPNPYLVSGAGGVALLMAINTLRQTEEYFGATPRRSDTHPDYSERIQRFDSVGVLEPAKFRHLRAFRVATGRIMALVHDGFVGAITSLSAEDLAEIRKIREQTHPTP